MDSVTISNLYLVKIINKTQIDKEVQIKLINPKTRQLKLTTGQTLLTQQGTLESVLIVSLNQQSLSEKSTPLELGIYEGDTLLEVYRTNFLGPDK